MYLTCQWVFRFAIIPFMYKYLLKYVDKLFACIMWILFLNIGLVRKLLMVAETFYPLRTADIKKFNALNVFSWERKLFSF